MVKFDLRLDMRTDTEVEPVIVGEFNQESKDHLPQHTYDRLQTWNPLMNPGEGEKETFYLQL